MCRRNRKGFSLLELLIVISIVAVLGTVGVGFYLNYAKNIEIKTVANTLISDLKQAQSKSMAGVGGLKWGVHLVNGDTDYYETFSSPSDYSDSSKSIVSTNYLSKGVSFSDPASGSTKDIIFNKITGGTTETSIALNSSEITKTINISSVGSVTDGEFVGSNIPDEEIPAPDPVAVGDTYQGGIVAYILQEGDPGYSASAQHGFIAAVNDQSAGIVFSVLNTINAGTSSGVGTGQANTIAIVFAYGADNNAAKLCSDLSLAEKTDWYLPSKDELNKLYLNKTLIGGFSSAEYWTSTERSDWPEPYAWKQSMGSGSQYQNGDKQNNAYVRCIRSF